MTSLLPGRSWIVSTLAWKLKARYYLEIGAHANECFNAIAVENKIGIEPTPRGGNWRGTSDEFFWRIPSNTAFDLVFVDGDHRTAQVWRDVKNALAHTLSCGAIVMHDCLPEREEQQRDEPVEGQAWLGGAWKVLAWAHSLPDVDCAVVDTDWGCGVLLARENSRRAEEVNPLALEWKDYQRWCNEAFKVIRPDGLIKWIGGD